MAIQNLKEYEGHPLLAQNPDLNRVLQVFSGISNHPRTSKKEGPVRAHLIELATEQGWKVEQDETGNVSFQVQATPGKENVTPVILQGHMDIVAFPQDEHLPRQAEIVDKSEGGIGDTDDEKGEKGLWMQTVGREMTLGADNGMGLALAIAMMMDPELEHGPVTILATVDEETGMTGAKTLDPKLIPETGIFINLDSEDGPENICIGCAGSADTVAYFPIEARENIPERHTLMDLDLKKFPGGHSGINIHLGRGNAIQAMADLLSRMQTATSDLRLIDFSGGEKRNSIPVTAHARIAVPETDIAALEETVKAFVDELKQGEEIPDPDMTGALAKKNAQNIEASLIRTESVELVGALSDSLRSRLLGIISATPTGPFSSAELANVGKLVTLSNNLGVATTTPDSIELVSMTRGANIDELRAKLSEIRTLFTDRGASLKEAEEPTSGWLEDPTTSPAVAVIRDAVTEAGRTPNFMAYHAGLESGIITGKAKGPMSAVATGPLIKEAHTPRERVSLQGIVDEVRTLRGVFAQTVKMASQPA